MFHLLNLLLVQLFKLIHGYQFITAEILKLSWSVNNIIDEQIHHTFISIHISFSLPFATYTQDPLHHWSIVKGGPKICSWIHVKIEIYFHVKVIFCHCCTQDIDWCMSIQRWKHPFQTFTKITRFVFYIIILIISPLPVSSLWSVVLPHFSSKAFCVLIRFDSARKTFWYVNDSSFWLCLVW